MTIPLRGPAFRLRPAVHVERATYAHALHAVCYPQSKSAEAIARQRWGTDEATPLILRGADDPANRLDAGWAGVVAGEAVRDFIGSLAPLSAGAKLLEAAVRVSLDGVDTLRFPQRVGPIAPDQVAWVPELAPVPVIQFVTGNATLGPARKLAAIAVASRELIESSAGEAVIRTLLREKTRRCLWMRAYLATRPRATSDRPVS